jgi:PPOX class probable F420-dependent enzyme
VPNHGQILTPAQRAFATAARRAILATTRAGGRPRPVPVCFVLLGPDSDAGDAPVVYVPLDEKPKRSADPHALARVRDIVARPAVSLLVDRWDEDWERLGWLRLDGRAALVEPDVEPRARANALAALRVKYPQYAGHALEARPLIRIEIDSALGWGRLDGT